MSSAAQVKGWCPGAYRPMMSGDGLIVRVRPKLACLSAAQAVEMCDIADRFGNGVIDLTSRANLQLRGIAPEQHQDVLDALLDLDLLDATPELEARRNIVVTPFWQAGDLTSRLHDALCAQLDRLPDLPAKMGIALDTGAHPILQNASSDFRLEPSETTSLILRLDGLDAGRAVTEHTAIDALVEMAQWFCESGGHGAKRMAQHVWATPRPADWTMHRPKAAQRPPEPGGNIFGAAFGSMKAADLSALIKESNATAMRITPWRLFQLENAVPTATHGFVTLPDDPLLRVHACPGAPACAAATVDTRTLARTLAPTHRELHVSGCDKGCAHPRIAATTLVGRDGAYDLVEQGHPWDQPRQRGLTRQDLLTPAS